MQGDFAERTRREGIQVAVDARRGLDVLERRPDVEGERIGFVGLSQGAMMGGVLAGVDKRFRAFALVAGMVGFSHFWRDTTHPAIAPLREASPKDVFARYLTTIASIDAEHYIATLPRRPFCFSRPVSMSACLSASLESSLRLRPSRRT